MCYLRKVDELLSSDRPEQKLPLLLQGEMIIYKHSRLTQEVEICLLLDAPGEIDQVPEILDGHS